MDFQETQIYQSLLIAIVVIGCIIGYFIYLFIRQQRKVLRIERQNAIAQVNALENDRSRIAADLHDDIAPMLSAVKMRINSFELSDNEDAVQLEKTNSIIDDMATRLRSISFDLMPVSLQVKGICTAIQEYVSLLDEQTPVEIRLFIRGNIVLPDQKAVHVYRIVQEIVHNTLKHAQASELRITLAEQKGQLLLQTIDNGIGFHYSKTISKAGGLGLRSLQNRVTLLSGRMDLKSTEGKGTTYHIEIPLYD
jgi:signal transduction histidine kinase